MAVRYKALIWAALILVAAFVSASMGMSDAASFGIISGLSGAAWGTLNADIGCGRSCLQ